MTDTASKKETAEGKRAREQRERREFLEKRKEQLSGAETALGALREQVRAARSNIKRGEALSSHSNGFYEEISKLAKGKILIGVTDLVVAQANDIIRDAKQLIKGDVYLDRIREFVPAGDNPVYPDVLVSIRSVRDSLDRYDQDTKNRINALLARIEKAQTVIGALKFVLDGEADAEEDKNYPGKDAIEPYVEGRVSESCLSRFTDSYEKYFDFDRLDKQTVEEYLLPLDEEADGQPRADHDATADEESADGGEDQEQEEEAEDEDGASER
jgi:hypothetical protein